jgi:hypothetical protein
MIVSPFAMIVSQKPCLFAMIVGREILLFASPSPTVRKPLQLGFLDFGGHQVFTVAHHFVPCWGSTTLRNTSNGTGRVF